MKRFACLLLLAAAAGCSSGSMDRAAPAEETEPSTESTGRTAGLVDPGPVEITVDTGDRDLGAYALTLLYDGALVRVSSVEGTPDFTAPQYAPDGMRNGKLKLVAFKVVEGPKGRTAVARVTFDSLRGGSSRLSVRLESLYDGDGRPVKGRAESSRDHVP